LFVAGRFTDWSGNARKFRMGWVALDAVKAAPRGVALHMVPLDLARCLDFDSCVSVRGAGGIFYAGSITRAISWKAVFGANLGGAGRVFRAGEFLGAKGEFVAGVGATFGCILL
jgi:hypothetical protein